MLMRNINFPVEQTRRRILPEHIVDSRIEQLMDRLPGTMRSDEPTAGEFVALSVEWARCYGGMITDAVIEAVRKTETE